MSEAENQRILSRAIEHFNDPRERNRYFELYDPGCVLHGYPGVEPGIESIRKFYDGFWRAFPDVVLRIEDLFAAYDRVACRFVFDATHRGEFMGVPPTGKRVQVTGITILRFAARRCVERWSEANFLSLLQQLGVVPSAA